MAEDFEQWERFPYSPGDYAKRAIWAMVWHSGWKLLPKRGPTRHSRAALLRIFGAKAGPKCGIASTAWIEFPWHLDMASHCSLGPRVTIYNLGDVTLGKHVVISQDAYLCAGTHDYSQLSYPLLRPPITVGDHVWICAGAFIGPGVTIGEGAVIGARAVVTKDVEPWTIVAGNPAKPVKKRRMKSTDESVATK